MTPSRRSLIPVALVVLALAAGCMGGGGVDQQRLAREEQYDWNRSANASYNVTGGEYHAVYRFTNTSTVEVYRQNELGDRSPLSVAGVKFRYPNGTVVGAERIDVSRSGGRTVIELPADRGQFAYTAQAGSKFFGTPVIAEGPHEVVLPAGMRVKAPLFGSVEPAGYTASREDNRVHLTWSETPRTGVNVQYYLERDFYLFTGLVGALLLAGVVGVVYFRLQIRALERERSESGFDLDDSGDSP